MLRIITIPLTPFQQNVRILYNEAAGKVCVLDPGGEVPRLSALLPDVVLEKILLTHAHIDHAGGVAALCRFAETRWGQAPILLASGAEEREFRRSLSQQAIFFGLSPEEYENVPEPDVLLEDGDTIEIAGLPALVLATPGHSPGHRSLFLESLEFEQSYPFSGETGARVTAPLLLAGDALFAGSIGRTDLPGGNHQQLLDSIREKLLVLPDNTQVFSGHGPNTTIGTEKKSNPFLT